MNTITDENNKQEFKLHDVNMKFNGDYEDLYDLTLRELIESYCILENLECGYHYGIVKQEDISRAYDEYNIREEYPESIYPDTILPDDILLQEQPLITWNKLKKILKNLNISKK